MIGEIKITGLKELNKRLSELPKELQKNASMSVLRAGLKPIVRKAKQKAPVGEGATAGLLKKSIGGRVKKVKGEITARVGPRSGFRIQVGTKADGKPIYKNPLNYAWPVEVGTSTASARPFMRPAADTSDREVLNEMGKQYDKYIAGKLKRLRKKNQG